MPQVQELQVIVHDLLIEGMIRINIHFKIINFITNNNFIIIEGMIINAAFQVVTFIEKLKLSQMWTHFKNYLKQQCKELDDTR